MLTVISLLTLIFLALLQVTVVSLNLAFVSVVAYSIFLKKTSVLVWLITVSILISLLANLSLGVVLLAFATTFFLLKFAAEFLPENNLIKIFLVGLSLPLSEVCILLFSRLLG